jgi:hypothetical protein
LRKRLSASNPKRDRARAGLDGVSRPPLQAIFRSRQSGSANSGA